MIPLLVDEDFNARIIRGLQRLAPNANFQMVRDVGLAGQPDAAVVEWAAHNDRVLVTHDVNTLIDAALQRVRADRPMAGVIAVPQRLAIGAAVADLFLIANCAKPQELRGQIWYLPL